MAGRLAADHPVLMSEGRKHAWALYLGMISPPRCLVYLAYRLRWGNPKITTGLGLLWWG
jgi:hypothetical protein